MFDFKDKVVLVTGASAGIGEATALLFAEHGARLSLVGRNEENLLKIAQQCRVAGKRKDDDVLPIVADLSTDEGCETVAAKTRLHFGKLDILVNNAGMGARTTIQRTDMAVFDRVFAINVRGVYNLTRLLVKDLVASKGVIVNVSSISGSMPSVGSLPYSMSKAALDHFSKCVALELAPLGVRVNTVSPGVTVSTFVQRLTGYSDEQYSSWLKDAERKSPLGCVSSAKEIGRLILTAADPALPSLTGVVMPIDCGGLLAGAGDSELMRRQVQ